MALRIQLLGPPQVSVDGRPIVVDTRKAVALLAYVAVVGRPVARDLLAELLWPEADPDGGRGALRRTLSVLRAGLDGRWLAVDRRQVALDASGVELDVAAFRERAAGTSRESLAAAADTYGGDFLAGFSLRDSAPFDEWQALEGEALRSELASVLRRLAELDAAGGRASEALTAGRRLVALDPLDESAHRLLMRLSASAGDRAAVARQYRACVRALETELGVPPESETTELYRSLVDRPLPAVDAPDGLGPAQPLGDHARELLQAAAVLGASVDPDLARLVSGLDEGAATAAFEELVRAGVLAESDGRERYVFPTPSGHAAALAGIGLARRRRLHRAAAAALDRASPDRPTVAARAVHLAAAGDTVAAAEAHRRAAEEARRLAAHADTADHARAALGLGHPDRLALLEALGDAETLRGRYGDALAAYEQAAVLAPPAELARLEHRLGALHLRRGAPELADLHLAAALARLPDAPSPLRARILADRGLGAVRRGQEAVATRLARASLREARKDGDADAESQAENLLAMLARRRGDVAAARRHLRRSLERSGVADDPGARVAALNHLALLERAAGNLEDALALTEEALRRCVVAGDRHREAALRNNRADLLHALGRPGEAADELVRSVKAFSEVGDRQALEPEIWKLVDW